MEKIGGNPEFVINQETGMIKSYGHEYANTPRMQEFVRRANKIRESLPLIPENHTRLWRGNRPGEVGVGSRFTDSLEGIALPFVDGYGGELSYIDIPTDELDKYVSSGGPSEFNLTLDLAKEAKIAKEN